MDLVLYSFFLVSAAIGTGCSFISDVFFIFSFKNHRLRVHEIKMLERLQFAGICSCLIALASRIGIIILQFKNQLFIDESLQYSMMLILCIILVATITLRGFHLPALLRHQGQYNHLSDSFMAHHTALITTSALNLISWLYVLFLVAIEERTIHANVNFVVIILTYIFIVLFITQVAQHIKGFYKNI